MMNVEQITNAVNFSRETVGERMPKVFYLREEHKTKVPTKAELLARFTEKVEKAESFDFDKLAKEFKKENRKDFHLAKWGCRRNRVIDNHEKAIKVIKDFLLNKCPKGEFLIQSTIADSFRYYDIFGGRDFKVGVDKFARIDGALEAALSDLEKEGKVKREIRKCLCRSLYSNKRLSNNRAYKKCFMVLA